jgi:serine/threonine protein kinase
MAKHQEHFAHSAAPTPMPTSAVPPAAWGILSMVGVCAVAVFAHKLLRAPTPMRPKILPPVPVSNLNAPTTPIVVEQLEESNNIRRYEMMEEVGRGNMAVVHRAKSLKTGHIVAIKLISEALKGDDEFTTRFIREVEISRQLRHPNIVRLLAVDTNPAAMFMAMEFVDGRHLDLLIASRGMPLKQALSLAIPIADGFHYAHKRGLIHRDIKPSNIMVNTQGTPKILDFGLALGEGMSRLTMVGFSMGTPSYMAPEQLTTGEVDARSDQYSFGVVFYQMLAGHCPFEGGDPISIGMRHVKEAPPRLRAQRPEIPEALERLVLKMLAKKPSDRYADLGQVLEELKGVQDGSLVN